MKRQTINMAESKPSGYLKAKKGGGAYAPTLSFRGLPLSVSRRPNGTLKRRRPPDLSWCVIWTYR